MKDYFIDAVERTRDCIKKKRKKRWSLESKSNNATQGFIAAGKADNEHWKHWRTN